MIIYVQSIFRVTTNSKLFIFIFSLEVLSSHHIKTFVFTYFETKSLEIQSKNQTDILLDMVRNLSADLKLKAMRNYFIPGIDILRLIPEEKYSNLAEKLDQFCRKPVETIKQMKKNFQNITRWFHLKVPSADDYSKLNIHVWHLRSLLFLALKDPDYLYSKRFEHILELSNTFFPSSETTDKMSNVEDLLFTWLNIVITARLRTSLPECFDRQHEHEVHNKYYNNKVIWLEYQLFEPITLIFYLVDFYDDAEIDTIVSHADGVEENQYEVNTGNVGFINFKGCFTSFIE